MTTITEQLRQAVREATNGKRLAAFCRQVDWNYTSARLFLQGRETVKGNTLDRVAKGLGLTLAKAIPAEPVVSTAEGAEQWA